jgi:uncharacterized protein YfaT (DUF1175 family)
VAAPLTRAKAAERDGALMMFRVSEGPPPRYAEFADAKTLIRLNARFLGRDVSALRPGDLLYFRQQDQRLPDHVMVFVGRSAFEPEGTDWVVYHTGPSTGEAAQEATGGEVRKVRLADLQRHPAERWRPVFANHRFVGVFRPTLFTM